MTDAPVSFNEDRLWTNYMPIGDSGSPMVAVHKVRNSDDMGVTFTLGQALVTFTFTKLRAREFAALILSFTDDTNAPAS